MLSFVIIFIIFIWKSCGVITANEGSKFYFFNNGWKDKYKEACMIVWLLLTGLKSIALYLFSPNYIYT